MSILFNGEPEMGTSNSTTAESTYGKGEFKPGIRRLDCEHGIACLMEINSFALLYF